MTLIEDLISVVFMGFSKQLLVKQLGDPTLDGENEAINPTTMGVNP